MKKNVEKYGILALLITLAAISQTLGLKANIGVGACWDAVSLNVYQLTGLKVGTFSMIANLICVMIQILILKKDFRPVKFLKIPVEGACYTIEKRFGIGFSRCRFSIDAVCIILSVALSLVFNLSFKIREGTVAGMLLLVPLMGWCMKKERILLKCIKKEKILFLHA